MAGPERENTAPSNGETQERKKVKASLVEDDNRDRKLSHEDAVAGCPSDSAVTGEEDAGIGVEFLVRESEDKEKAGKKN